MFEAKLLLRLELQSAKFLCSDALRQHPNKVGIESIQAQLFWNAFTRQFELSRIFCSHTWMRYLIVHLLDRQKQEFTQSLDLNQFYAGNQIRLPLEYIEVADRSIPVEPFKIRKSISGRQIASLLQPINLYLNLGTKAVQKVTTNDHSILVGIYSMNPTWWNDHGHAGLQFHLKTLSHFISKEFSILSMRFAPHLKLFQICPGRWNHVKRLGTFNEVVKNGGASKINVKVGEAAS